MKKLKQISRSQFKTLLDLDMPVYASFIGYPHISQYDKCQILCDLCENKNWMQFRSMWRSCIDNATYLKTFFTVVDEDSDE